MPVELRADSRWFTLAMLRHSMHSRRLMRVPLLGRDVVIGRKRKPWPFADIVSIAGCRHENRTSLGDAAKLRRPRRLACSHGSARRRGGSFLFHSSALCVERIRAGRAALGSFFCNRCSASCLAAIPQIANRRSSSANANPRKIGNRTPSR